MMVEDNGYLLYKKGIQSEFFTFILDGKAEVYSGRQKFRSEVSRFTILCPELLSQTQDDWENGLEFSAYVPDFTCRVIQNSRILRIPRENFHKCLLGTLSNYSRPSKETRQKNREMTQLPSNHHRKTTTESTPLYQSNRPLDDYTVHDRLLSPSANSVDNVSSFCYQKAAGGRVEQRPRRQVNLDDINKGEIPDSETSESMISSQNEGRSDAFLATLSRASSVNFEPVKDDVELMAINEMNIQKCKIEAEELHASSKNVSETTALMANYM